MTERLAAPTALSSSLQALTESEAAAARSWKRVRLGGKRGAGGRRDARGQQGLGRARVGAALLALALLSGWALGGYALFLSVGCEGAAGDDGPGARRHETKTDAVREQWVQDEIDQARKSILTANDQLLARLRDEAAVEARAQVAEELSHAKARVAMLEAEKDAAVTALALARQKADEAVSKEAAAESAAEAAAKRASRAEEKAAALAVAAAAAPDAEEEPAVPGAKKPNLRQGVIEAVAPGRDPGAEAAAKGVLAKSATAAAATVGATAREVRTALGKTPVEVVDVLRGTDNKNWKSNSRGNALPIIARPFGMAHWALTNVAKPEAWFFHPAKTGFAGIRCTHQPSPWIGDYGFFDVRPLWRHEPYKNRARTYDTRNAVFMPHYMSITLTSDCNVQNDCVKVDLTVTERAALFRIEYPSGGAMPGVDFEYLENLRRVNADGSTTSLLGGSSEPQNIVRFTAHSSAFSVFQPPALLKHHVFAEVVARDAGVGLKLDLAQSHVTWAPQQSKRTTVDIRIGTSFISGKQARINMRRELGEATDFEAASFDRIRTGGFDRWNELLGRVEVTADSQEELVNVEETLYSCLYRGLLFPRPLTEVEASGALRHWSPFDPVHFYEGPLVTDSGFWDAYRAQYPMLHLIYPDLVVDIMEGWVNAIREDPDKMLTQWASPGRVGSMEGSMGEVSLAEGIMNGALTEKSAQDAMDYIRRSATDTQVKNGRTFLAEFDEHGFVPVVPKRDGTVSLSLNYYLSDGVGAIVAEARGDPALADRLRARSSKWRTLWDSASMFFRAKRSTGQFAATFRENEWMGPYTEGGPWQYRFYVPHDPKGLRQAYEDARPAGAGQPSRMCQVLLDAMTRRGRVSNQMRIHEMTEMLQHSFGEYAHNNQPVHHVLYMFAHAGCPLDGQRYIHHTLRTQYGDFGYAGDEDNGEMSSWFVLSSIGLYALLPGSATYQVGAPPLFRSVTVHRPAVDSLGRAAGALKIRREVPATTTPLANFIPSTRVSWRGQESALDMDAVTIPYAELLEGGELVFRA